MGNPSHSKCRQGVNESHTIVASLAILLWITAGINAESVEGQFRGIGSREAHGDLYHQHRSYQKRDVDSHSCGGAMDDEDAEMDSPTIKSGRCGDIRKRANELREELPQSGKYEKLVSVFSDCTRGDIHKIHEDYKMLFRENIFWQLYYKFKSIWSNFGAYQVTSELIFARTASLRFHLAFAYYDAVKAWDYISVARILAPLDCVSAPSMFDAFRTDYGAAGQQKHEDFLTHGLAARLAKIVRSLLTREGKYPGSPNGESSACEDAEKIIKDRETGVWVKEDVDDDFHNILVTSSRKHLRRVSECFRDRTGLSLRQVIESEHHWSSGKEAYSNLVQYAEDKAAYFATILNEALTGFWGVSGRPLNLIIPWRAEIDLGDIKIAYQRLFNTSLYEDVALGTSYEYKDLLLALIGT